MGHQKHVLCRVLRCVHFEVALLNSITSQCLDYDVVRADKQKYSDPRVRHKIYSQPGQTCPSFGCPHIPHRYERGRFCPRSLTMNSPSPSLISFAVPCAGAGCAAFLGGAGNGRDRGGDGANCRDGRTVVTMERVPPRGECEFAPEIPQVR